MKAKELAGILLKSPETDVFISNDSYLDSPMIKVVPVVVTADHTENHFVIHGVHSKILPLIYHSDSLNEQADLLEVISISKLSAEDKEAL